MLSVHCSYINALLIGFKFISRHLNSIILSVLQTYFFKSQKGDTLYYSKFICAISNKNHRFPLTIPKLRSPVSGLRTTSYTSLSAQSPGYRFRVPVQFFASRWFCCIFSWKVLHQKYVNRASPKYKVYNRVQK